MIVYIVSATNANGARCAVTVTTTVDLFLARSAFEDNGFANVRVEDRTVRKGPDIGAAVARMKNLRDL